VIHERWVLTAAHCQVEPGDVVIVGRHDLTSSDGVEIVVDLVVDHAEFNHSTQDNDVALLHLAVAATTVPVLELGGSDLAIPGAPVTVVGWGALLQGGATSETLHQVEVEVVDQVECLESYAGLTPNMICAGTPGGGRDSCQGDSGGPLVVETLVEGNPKPWHVGIVSFGIGCALPNFPGVYTRTSRYHDWIETCAVGG
jgi:secreted trypsin-like serine protease